MTAPREKCPDFRVRFERGLEAQIVAIDGTWRRNCLVTEIGDSDAMLTVPASIEGLQLAEFFLLLSSPGLAYRRCSLQWVNGDGIGVSFHRVGRKKTQRTAAQETRIE